MATSIQEYSETEAALASLAQKYKGVVFQVATPDGMRDAKESRKELSTYRIALEKKRVEIKAPALKRAQEIDSEARRITAAISALEDPITAQIETETKREEREKAAAIEAERLRILAEQEALKRAEESRMAAERAEIKRQQDELAKAAAEARAKIEAAERESRLKIEEQERAARAKQEEADRAAKAVRDAEEARLKAERDRLEAERRAVEEAKRKEQAEAEAKAKAIRDAEEAKQREARRKEAEKADAKGMAALFRERYKHLPECAGVVQAINAYLGAK